MDQEDSTEQVEDTDQITPAKQEKQIDKEPTYETVNQDAKFEKTYKIKLPLVGIVVGV